MATLDLGGVTGIGIGLGWGKAEPAKPVGLLLNFASKLLKHWSYDCEQWPAVILQVTIEVLEEIC